MGGSSELAGHAFISYVREDSGAVDALQLALKAAGIPVWRDTSNLWPGEDWRARIRHEITRNALVFIACFSRQSVARERSYQNEELALAVDQLRQRRPDVPWLIPVRFDDLISLTVTSAAAGRWPTCIELLAGQGMIAKALWPYSVNFLRHKNVFAIMVLPCGGVTRRGFPRAARAPE